MFDVRPDSWFEDGRKRAVIAGEAMVVSPNPQAALTAYDLLRAGGTAMDAAIGAMGVTSLVEASQSGPGGDCFAIIHHPRRGVLAYNGSGRAPAAAQAEHLLAQGLACIPRISPHAVTIPGAVEAWCHLHADFGRLDLARVLAPAIAYAEEGFVLHRRIIRDWEASRDLLVARPETARHFLKDGTAPRVGDRWRLPGYGRMFREIAAQGPAAFYESAFTTRLVRFLGDLGGSHCVTDFASHRGAYVDPISLRAYGQSFHECPPNGQGIVALVLIGLLERRLASHPIDSLAGHHLMAEASKIAFALRDDLIGDPDGMENRIEALLTGDLLDRLAAGIQSDQVAPRQTARRLLPEHRDTSYVAVVDRDGMAVSLIASIYTDFGSTLCEPESGILLQDRGSGFVLEEGHPNRLAGGRRPMHTIIPGLAADAAGRPSLCFGVTGGHYQPVGHALLAHSIFAEGRDPQEALNLPRSHCPQAALAVEAALSHAIREGLASLGHEVALSGHPLGGGHAILIDHQRGVLVGGTDGRRDGIVVGY